MLYPKLHDHNIHAPSASSFQPLESLAHVFDSVTTTAGMATSSTWSSLSSPSRSSRNLSHFLRLDSTPLVPPPPTALVPEAAAAAASAHGKSQPSMDRSLIPILRRFGVHHARKFRERSASYKKKRN